MNTVEIVQSITIVASVIAAILAWVAKLKWSKEFAAAKDEVIKALNAQLAAKDDTISAVKAQLVVKEEIIKSKDNEIDNLRDLTPMKLREYFTSVKTQLEEYNEELKNQLEISRAELEKKKELLQKILPENKANETKIRELDDSRSELNNKIIKLESEIEQEQETLNSIASIEEEDLIKEASLALISSVIPGMGLTLCLSRLLKQKKESDIDNDK